MPRILLLLFLFLCFTAIASAQESSSEKTGIPEGDVSVTQQSVTINGERIQLTARAGTLQLRNENNEPVALFGFTSYTFLLQSEELHRDAQRSHRDTQSQPGLLLD